jgi:hypothetical protein
MGNGCVAAVGLCVSGAGHERQLPEEDKAVSYYYSSSHVSSAAQCQSFHRLGILGNCMVGVLGNVYLAGTGPEISRFPKKLYECNVAQAEGAGDKEEMGFWKGQSNPIVAISLRDAGVAPR